MLTALGRHGHLPNMSRFHDVSGWRILNCKKSPQNPGQLLMDKILFAVGMVKNVSTRFIGHLICAYQLQ